MATFQITGPDGKKYRVTGENAEGAFQALQQHLAGGESPAAATPAATDTRDSLLGKIDAGVRGAADMLSLGFADEIAAGLGTGFGLLGDYDEELARQRGIDESDAENRFGYRLGGQLAGGLTGGVGLARNGLSMGANAISAGQGLGRAALGSAADGAILGGLQGAGSGEGAGGRALNAAMGSAFGTALGGSAPYAIAGAQAAARPVLSPIMARLRPDQYAKQALGEGVRRSGMSTDDIANSLLRAQADDQSMFTVADAMGHSGQRMLSTVARNPNDMRQTVVDALTGRQMDQGRRVAAALQDASGSPLTAAQYRTLLEQSRGAEAAKNFAPVKTDIAPINVSDAVRIANKSISPAADNLAAARRTPTDIAARRSVEAGEASIRDPIRQAMKEARSYLASDNLTVTNVEKAFRAKTNIDQMIATATERGQGGLVAELVPMQNALDEALAKTSSQYARARDAYRVASQNIDAIDTGRQMAMPRSRLEDNMNTFGALPSEAAQRSARVGYFDPLITQAENRAGQMSNNARSLLSPRMRDELPVMAAPGRGPQLMDRVAREQRMFETANAALGGSKTADNLADAAEMSKFDPGVMMNLLRGRPVAAAVDAVVKMANEAKGMPPSVMERIAKSLLETNPQMAREMLRQGVSDAARRDGRRALANAILVNMSSAATGRLAAP